MRSLSWLSLGYMGIEGVVAVAAGLAANSIALIGFGFQSFIEGAASTIIIWRFSGSRTFSETAEHRAQKLVAVQFFILAPYVAIEAVQRLATGEQPEASLVGIVLTASSLLVMPWLGRAKIKLSSVLSSAAAKGEGRQNVLCAYLSAAVLAGLAGNALFGFWWLDPIAALYIAYIAIQEGREAWRGDDCGHH